MTRRPPMPPEVRKHWEKQFGNAKKADNARREIAERARLAAQADLARRSRDAADASKAVRQKQRLARLAAEAQVEPKPNRQALEDKEAAAPAQAELDAMIAEAVRPRRGAPVTQLELTEEQALAILGGVLVVPKPWVLHREFQPQEPAPEADLHARVVLDAPDAQDQVDAYEQWVRRGTERLKAQNKDRGIPVLRRW